jgi:sortase A
MTQQLAPPPSPPDETKVQPPIWQARRLSRPPRAELPGLALSIVYVAMGVAVLASWFVAFSLGLSGLQDARGQQLRYSELRETLAAGTTKTGGAIDPGTPIALIAAPRIGLRQVVVEGTAAEDLRAGPGHRRDSPLPGQAGTSVIYGRTIMFGAPFLRVRILRPGDVITVVTGQGTFTYSVDGVRRAGDPLPDQVPAGGGRLTLISAEGVSWRSGWAPNQLLYVDATLQGKPAPDEGGRPTVIPTQETAMVGDPSAWTSLVLWLQGLAVSTLGASWSLARWGRAQTWLTFIPLILATLWGATDSALQLLPNVM